MRFGGRAALGFSALAVVSFTACTATSPPPSRLRLSQAGPAAFEAHGSVGQVWLTGASPDEALYLVARDGSIVDSGKADAQGSEIFRNVAAGHAYRVAATEGGALVASPPVVVGDWEHHPR